MDTELFIFTVTLAGCIFASILFVIFGQITVKKLRKTPGARDSLGVEFANGWDILNVAQSLSLPKIIAEKINQSPIAFMYADRSVLYENTTKFDRLLARLFWYTYMISALGLLLLVALSLLGVFD